MRNNGFTLIELLIVVGIIAVLLSIFFFTDFNSYRGDAFRAEVSALGGALQRARADAFNNITQARHGVAIHPDGYDGYVIFECGSGCENYATIDPARDIRINASYGVTIAPTEVIFNQLSGDAVTSTRSQYDGDVTLTDPSRNVTAKISINHEGKISW